MTIYWALSCLYGEDTSLWHSGLPASQVSLVMYFIIYFCLYIYVYAIMRTWFVGFAKWVVETDNFCWGAWMFSRIEIKSPKRLPGFQPKIP